MQVRKRTTLEGEKLAARMYYLEREKLGALVLERERERLKNTKLDIG